MRGPLEHAARLSCRLLAVAVAPLAAASAGEQRVLVVAGLGGEAAYEDAFQRHAKAAADGLTASGATVTLLTGEAASGAGIRQALADIGALATEGGSVIAHFIGHGSYDGEHYRFNVPGPDPTANDLAAWLAPLPKPRLVILATSAAGGAAPLFTNTAAVILATRDGRETNAVRFPEFWTAALTDAGADTDKDGRLSATEAFDHASRAVASHYERENRIATEHPRLQGSAANFLVAKVPGAPARQVDQATAHLVERSAALIRRIDALKAERGDHGPDEYFAQLQELLLELALVERELDAERRQMDERNEDDPAP